MNSSTIYGNNSYYPTTYPSSAVPTPTYIPPTSLYPANVQPTLINGRSVDNIEEVTAGEVPLNGSLAIFPKKDGSVIYVKSMNANGIIDTKYYIPAPDGFVDNPGSHTEDQAPVISNQDILAAIMNMQDQINNFQQLLQQRPPRNNSKQNNRNGNKEKIENE